MVGMKWKMDTVRGLVGVRCDEQHVSFAPRAVASLYESLGSIDSLRLGRGGRLSMKSSLGIGSKNFSMEAQRLGDDSPRSFGLASHLFIGNFETQLGDRTWLCLKLLSLSSLLSASTCVVDSSAPLSSRV